MTNRKTVLTELLNKVETGGDVYGFGALGSPVLRGYGESAYHGSLDAAKALHETLLPGTSQYSIVTDPTCLCVKVAWWPNRLSGGDVVAGEGWHEANPARAWLCAILEALIAQGETDET